MASKTDFLQLILPLNGEYEDTWDEPTNENFNKIDVWAKSVEQERVDARFGKASLKEFLEIAHETDGSLKPTVEVFEGRNSFLYGDEAGAVDFDLPTRLNFGDKEVFWAREGLLSLRDSLAKHTYLKKAILAGAKDSNGYPTWLGFTGANAQVDGTATNILMTIGGHNARVRSLEQITVSGAAAVKYLYAMFAINGVIRVPTSNNGASGADTINAPSKVRIFRDASIDFTAVDVKAGDVLEITGGANEGQYLIAQVAPDTNFATGDVNALMIVGVFPGGALASMSYTIADPFAVTFGFDDIKAQADDKLYIGEADFDGSSITAVRALHFEDMFVGAWQAVDVVSTPQFNLSWNHNLMSDVLEVIVQASTTNDGLQPIVPMDIGRLTSTLALNFSNTQLFSPGTFNPGSSGATYSPLPSLSGTVTSSLGGTVILDNAVQVQFTQTAIQVKNPVPGTFFKNFAGAAVTTGFVRVIVRRKA